MATDYQFAKREKETGTDNRRQWARYETDPAEVSVTVGRRQRKGVVVDESIGGVGVMMVDVKKLDEGAEVKLQYRGIEVPAAVKSVRKADDGLYHVGFGWLDTAIVDAPAVLKNRRSHGYFVNHQGVWLTCDVLEVAKDGMATIVLWDGAYFEVPSERIQEASLENRTAELHEFGEDICLLAALYRLGDQGSVEQTLEAVLDFEFGCAW